MEKRCTFIDAHEAVGGILKNFESYWQSECVATQNQLMDGIYCICLSDVYGAGMGEDMRFGESEQYLGQLGVLDESTPWHGKQVIIRKLLQKASFPLHTTWFVA